MGNSGTQNDFLDSLKRLSLKIRTRQFPLLGVERYCVDFYCPELKLAIEVDGDSHFADGAAKKDKVRVTDELEGWFGQTEFPEMMYSDLTMMNYGNVLTGC